MGARRSGREMALQVLYQMDATGVTAGQGLSLYFGNLSESLEGEEFANRLVRGFESECEAVDEIIRRVSHHWRIERMTKVDRNILRLGTYELLKMEDVPRRVTLNEAVELAKRFGSENSAGFVNGVLDRIATDLGRE